MDNEASSSEEKYKAVEYLNHIYRIPVRRIDHDQYLFLSDVRAIVPQATALTASDKLIPFAIDPITNLELTPRRVLVSEFSSVWQAHVPPAAADENQQRMVEMDAKLDSLSQQIHHLLSVITPPHHAQTQTITSIVSPTPTPAPAPALAHAHAPAPAPAPTSAAAAVVAVADATAAARSPNHPTNASPGVVIEAVTPASAPTPAPTSVPVARASSSRHADGDAPPSYETSILGNIKTLTDQLRLYESHIANRHKSPRWLARRSEWVHREPTNIEQLAYQLIQLEMALLWTAVSESWIQERETWLTLVASARTERHLAGAMISLERHTLVMDETWIHHMRETWINELLEMIVLPLTHGN
ncbi:hypothetical protein BX666DRAFT_1847261 [Dichotomocladium elegans]|nr:hypothetical protein BX666DRAFT_1847261 [Dichotomocladium elegans]